MTIRLREVPCAPTYFDLGTTGRVASWLGSERVWIAVAAIRPEKLTSIVPLKLEKSGGGGGVHSS